MAGAISFGDIDAAHDNQRLAGDSAGTNGVNPGASGNNAIVEGSSGSGFDTFDPAAIEGAGSNGTAVEQPRKRGRKPGSKNQAKTTAKVDLEKVIAKGFYMFHNVLYESTKKSVPELYMSQEESLEIGGAFRDLAAEYGQKIEGKTAAWINVIMAVGGAYTGRFVLYNLRTAGTKKQQAQQRSNTGAFVGGPIHSPAH